jgi:hypothetical protein
MKKYLIYQLKETADVSLYFASFDSQGKVDIDNYNMIYSGNAETLPNYTKKVGASSESLLDFLFMVFNEAHPQDFRGHSLSVSDVVCLQEDSVREYYYVDTFGFVKLEAFGECCASDIDWDTDGEDVDGLPGTVQLDPEVDSENIADVLSDKYGFCVNGFVENRQAG